MQPGFGFALLAYGLWGVVPLFWKQLQGIPADEILAHRVIWSFVFFLVLVLLRGQARDFLKALKSPGALRALFLASVLIGVNWFLFIYAVLSDRVLESSLGYFINPLVNVLLGRLVLKESLTRWRWVSIGLASIGVLLLGWKATQFPWIALTLAWTFAFYGLIRKKVTLRTETASCVEALMLLPLALGYVVWLSQQGQGHFSTDGGGVYWLIAAGVVTALPLLFFAEAARRLPLSTLGFFQYISPTFQFLIAVVIYREPFSWFQGLSFGFIWLALGVFTAELLFMRTRSHFRKRAALRNPAAPFPKI